MKRRPKPQDPGMPWFVRYFAPASVGIAYAISKMTFLHLAAPQLVWQVDFYQCLLLGILQGFVIRPIAQNIFWSNAARFCVVWGILMFHGVGVSACRLLLQHEDLQPGIFLLLISDGVGLLAMTMMVTLLMRSSQRHLTLQQIQQRFSRWLQKTGWLALLASTVGYGLVFCFIQAVTANPEWAPSLIENGFLEEGRWRWMLLQGIFLLLPLFPLFAVVSGHLRQLILVFLPLMFITSTVLPVVLYAGHLPVAGFLYQLSQGLLLQVLFCYGVVFVLRMPPSQKK